MEMYDNPKHIVDTFTPENLSEYLIQAQWAEFVELKKLIAELYNIKKSPLKILDIGVGDARILKHLAGIQEIWETIEHYDGIDVAQNCIDISTKIIHDLHIEEKAEVHLLDAAMLQVINRQYDLVISTWVTAGNFYPFHWSVEKFKPGFDMSTNDKFTLIFRQAYELLTHDGELFIGSMYIDNDANRKKQCTGFCH